MATEMATDVATVHRPWRSRRVKDALLGYALVAPSLVLFGVFVFYPFVENIRLALHRTPPFPGLPERYVGLDQVGDVLASPEFGKSLVVTVEFVLLTVPAGVVLGLLLAMLAHRQLRGMTVYRTVFSSTVATSVAAASVIFFTLLNPQVGLFTYWLGRSGDLGVLEDPQTALIAVAVTTIWQNLGLSFILMSAGLQGVPDDLYDAAAVDGAGARSRFWHVTVPMLSPTLFFAAVVGSIMAFQAFGQIDLLTEGGPDNETNVLVYSIYKDVFRFGNDGIAAVKAIALFLIVFVLTVVQLQIAKRRVTYER
jgi:sn-glycerol 3-phosphate transport system permease protein